MFPLQYERFLQDVEHGRHRKPLSAEAAVFVPAAPAVPQASMTVVPSSAGDPGAITIGAAAATSLPPASTSVAQEPSAVGPGTMAVTASAAEAATAAAAVPNVSPVADTIVPPGAVPAAAPQTIASQGGVRLPAARMSMATQSTMFGADVPRGPRAMLNYSSGVSTSLRLIVLLVGKADHDPDSPCCLRLSLRRAVFALVGATRSP
jgi:hypothetical protein